MNDDSDNNQIKKLEQQLGFPLPASYHSLLVAAKAHTKKLLFLLYSVDQVIKLNKTYRGETFAPGAFLVGSDGGGEALVLDVRDGSPTNGQFYFMPFIPMGWKDAILAGSTLEEIVKTYTERWG